jgi:adenylate cyclase
VLIYADLRGFTSLTDSVERAALAPMLDAYFEQMVPPVVDRGGQVLKFLGDGLLATFNLEDQPRDSVCHVALRTGVETLIRVRRLNEERKSQGLPVMELDIALHLGDVLYGNVGAAGRQDFTVIGPAVNEASRLEFLCQELGHHLLVSESFAQAATACAEHLIPLGRHELRGVRRAQEIYTVDPDVFDLT